jgi:hypothetical protein
VAGASAAITSDAVMTPFDGEYQDSLYYARILIFLSFSYSNKTTHASAQLGLQIRDHLRTFNLPNRGAWSIFCVLSNNTTHDDSIHGRSVLGLRAHTQLRQSNAQV